MERMKTINVSIRITNQLNCNDMTGDGVGQNVMALSIAASVEDFWFARM